ncbi:MAG TPA: gamma-glutamylcyclotransferase family protein [Kofleriaceae bacterium]|nr:gamma-glutamylcyclotransferase family protein [Kofleriaceae bacterium]
MTQQQRTRGGTCSYARVSYFAYGSNLDERQMRARCPSAGAPVRATLDHHVLVFGGRSSTWGGAVANIVPARGAQVEGLIYQIDREDVLVLDQYEGHPIMYERAQRLVVDAAKRRRRVAVYVLRDRAFRIGAPPARYFDVLARAYVRYGFDLQPLLAAARAGQPGRHRI